MAELPKDMIFHYHSDDGITIKVDAIPLVRCGECRWWRKKDDSPYGYCYACKHGHYSEHWEIGIYRLYKADWFCADGEREAQE